MRRTTDDNEDLTEEAYPEQRVAERHADQAIQHPVPEGKVWEDRVRAELQQGEGGGGSDVIGFAAGGRSETYPVRRAEPSEDDHDRAKTLAEHQGSVDWRRDAR